MARPRIFISSTFYDLRQVRSDIERAILELGYEPIRHETGAVPYQKTESLETGAYREIDMSDVIVFITGGKFGSESAGEPGYSISQVELERALAKGLQVFIFAEKNVLHEYNTYKLNKDSNAVKYSSVNDVRVFHFIDELFSLPRNIPLPASRSLLTSQTFSRTSSQDYFIGFCRTKSASKNWICWKRCILLLIL